MKKTVDDLAKDLKEMHEKNKVEEQVNELKDIIKEMTNIKDNIEGSIAPIDVKMESLNKR